MNYLQRLHRFLICFLQDDCEYSIKKLLALIFSGLAIYLAIWTTKVDFFFETLGFIAILLGIRAWERQKINKNGENEIKSDDNNK